MAMLRSDTNDLNQKRRTPRVGVGTRAQILVHAARQVTHAFVRDLSTGGICVTLEKQIAVGGHFSLLLTKDDGKYTHLLYEVRRCDPAEDGFFDIGARLVSNSKPEESPPSPQTPAETAQTSTAPPAAA